MKKGFLLFVLLAAVAMAQSTVGDLSGMWSDANSSFKVFMFQKGSEIHVLVVGRVNGALVVSYGPGTIKGSTVEYDYEIAGAPSNWYPGHVSAVASADGKSLTGTYRATNGATGRVSYSRVN